MELCFPRARSTLPHYVIIVIDRDTTWMDYNFGLMMSLRDIFSVSLFKGFTVSSYNILL